MRSPLDRPVDQLRNHAVTVILVGLLLLTIAGAPGSGPPPVNRLAPNAGAEPVRACPLSPAQERAAVDAFDKMMPVLFHPRCLNCHGGMNPYVAPQVGRHLGGQMTDSAGHPMPAAACQDCHSGLPGWDVPGSIMFFVGKNAKELCKQFKEFAPSGSAEFVQHMTHEAGPQFIDAAFEGLRALNTLGEVSYEDAMGHPPTPEKPPGTRQGLVNFARDWATKIDRGWTDPECGCMVHGAWYGTVHSQGTFTGAGMPGAVLTVASDALVMFEIDHKWDKRGSPGIQYYKSTGGTVTWNAQASAGCQGGMSGVVPLDTLDVDDHPMGELRLENRGSGVYAYEPTTGSWPDKWSPEFTVLCNMSGTKVKFPMTNLNPVWWNYDGNNPPTTRNPDRLQGSYRWTQPAIDILWTWDLKRQP
jgi:hypothetical protein